MGYTRWIRKMKYRLYWKLTSLKFALHCPKGYTTTEYMIYEKRDVSPAPIPMTVITKSYLSMMKL